MRCVVLHWSACHAMALQTFVNALDEDRYQQVLDLVSLRQDLNELPLGDRTEIGERGIVRSPH